MTGPEPFSRAAAERRLGPAAVKAIRESVDAAPPLRPEQLMRLRAVFDSAHSPSVSVPAPRAA